MGAPITIVDNLGGNTSVRNSTVSPLGEVRVENPASQLFMETWDRGIVDQVNMWTASAGGTGSSVTPSIGACTLTGGTVANSFAKLTSQLASRDINLTQRGIFRPVEPGYLLFNSRLNLQFPIPVNNLFNWGYGTSPASPTIASPVTQFVGLEVTVAGKLQAVVYQTGVRVLIKDLSVPVQGSVQNEQNPPAAPQPVDSSAHKYFVYFRGDIAYWCYEDKDNVVAQFQTGALGPDINALPLLFQIINNGGVSATLQINSASVGDTSHTGGTQLLSNGISLEPQCSNQDAFSSLVTIAAQGAGTLNSPDIVNTNGKGVNIGINTTVDAAGAYTVSIQGKDIVSGTYYTILTSASIAAAGFVLLSIYPGFTAAANTVANAVLPRTWRVQVVVTTGPITATIGASVIN